jgi:hypothetical protein
MCGVFSNTLKDRFPQRDKKMGAGGLIFIFPQSMHSAFIYFLFYFFEREAKALPHSLIKKKVPSF